MPECFAKAWNIYTRTNSVYAFPSLIKGFSYVVEESDPCRNADFLLGPKGVSRVRIEVYRNVYFGFVGHSLDLRRSWV